MTGGYHTAARCPETTTGTFGEMPIGTGCGAVCLRQLEGLDAAFHLGQEFRRG